MLGSMESEQSQKTPQEAKRATYTVRCSYCGYRNPPNHNFCVSCGKMLSHLGPNVAPTPSKGEADDTSPHRAYAKNQSVDPVPVSRSLLRGYVGGGLITIGVAVLIALIFNVMSLKPRPSAESNNLPTGMETGFWAVSSGDLLSDANNCEWGLLFLDDQHFTGVEPGEFGTYTLVDDNTVLLEAPNWSEYIKFSVAKSGKRTVVESENGPDCVLDLAVSNTSSGNLSKEILGTWELYYELISLDDEFGSGYLWEFRRNGELLVKHQDHGELEETGSYEFIESKLAVDLPVMGGQMVFTVYSIGDLMFFRNSDGENDLYMLRR
jgi:hypothetical protein